MQNKPRRVSRRIVLGADAEVQTIEIILAESVFIYSDVQNTVFRPVFWQRDFQDVDVTLACYVMHGERQIKLDFLAGTGA